MTSRPLTPTLFPYTTLFRSGRGLVDALGAMVVLHIARAGRPAFGLVSLFALAPLELGKDRLVRDVQDRKSTRLNSSHSSISYAVLCLKKKLKNTINTMVDQL